MYRVSIVRLYHLPSRSGIHAVSSIVCCSEVSVALLLFPRCKVWAETSSRILLLGTVVLERLIIGVIHRLRTLPHRVLHPASAEDMPPAKPGLEDASYQSSWNGLLQAVFQRGDSRVNKRSPRSKSIINGLWASALRLGPACHIKSDKEYSCFTPDPCQPIRRWTQFQEFS